MGFAELIGAFSDRTRHYRQEAAQAQQAEEGSLLRTLTSLTGREIDPQVRRQAMSALLEVSSGRGKLTRRDLGGYFGATEPGPGVERLLGLVDQIDENERAGREARDTPAPAVGVGRRGGEGYGQPEIQGRALPGGAGGVDPSAPVIPSRPLGGPVAGAPVPALPHPDAPESVWRSARDLVSEEYDALGNTLKQFGATPQEVRRILASKMGGGQPAEPVDRFDGPVNYRLSPDGPIAGSGYTSSLRPGLFDETGRPIPGAVAVPPGVETAGARPTPQRFNEDKVEDPNSPTGYSWIVKDPMTGAILSTTPNAPAPVAPPEYGGTSFVDPSGQRYVTRRGGGVESVGEDAGAVTPEMREAVRGLRAYEQALRGNKMYGFRQGEARTAMETAAWAKMLADFGFPPGTTRAQLEALAAGTARGNASGARTGAPALNFEGIRRRMQGAGKPAAGAPPPR